MKTVKVTRQTAKPTGRNISSREQVKQQQVKLRRQVKIEALLETQDAEALRQPLSLSTGQHSSAVAEAAGAVTFCEHEGEGLSVDASKSWFTRRSHAETVSRLLKRKAIAREETFHRNLESVDQERAREAKVERAGDRETVVPDGTYLSIFVRSGSCTGKQKRATLCTAWSLPGRSLGNL
jgi:hypothetical protein